MRSTGITSRLIALLTGLAVLAGPVAPLSSATKRPPRAIIKPDSPVRCNQAGVNIGGYGGSAHALAQPSSVALPTPAPPPAPAPPPPPLVRYDSKDQKVLRSTPLPVPKIGGGYIPPQAEQDRERYKGESVASIKTVAKDPVSTFSVDVDTGSYANVRRFLTQGQTPPVDAVRTEEMLNYFRYDYPAPKDRSRPFSVSTDMSTTPWNVDTRLLRIGIRGYDVARDARPASNLVFLIDVSGSMSSHDKLPLVKSSLARLAGRLGARDQVSIVVYAGAAGIVLDPTNNPLYIKQALDCLSAGGSTAGGQGMELAYATARAHFIKGGVNRVIMATDGDFNVGISSNEGIEAIVKKNRDAGITLTMLGFGQGNYNEALMERVADMGNGNYAYIDSALEAQKVLDEEMESTLFTIAKDVKVQIEFDPAVVKEYRLIGYENRILAEEDFNNDTVDAGDIGAGHQVTALYEIVTAGHKGWLPERHYDANKPVTPKMLSPPVNMAQLKLRYKLPGTDQSLLIEQPVRFGLLTNATAPRGDMAFAVAVAGFGQKLRGDKYLGTFSFADVRRIAGTPRGYVREEFLKLAALAEPQ